MDNIFYQIIDIRNLKKSALLVKSKSCTGKGLDNCSCKYALDVLNGQKEELLMALQQDTYKPYPIKRVYIDKPTGGKRELGIPTVIDKIIQQDILLVLAPIYENIFSPYSFGFRENRNIHQAINCAKEFMNNGYTHIVQIDIKNFFGEIQHDKMMSEIYKVIKDKKLLRLIRLYVQSDVMFRGRIIRNDYQRGISQGANLSPLLGNIYLHQLDLELSRRGIRFVRYADDITLFCNSQKSAEAIQNSIIHFIENKLLLKVNRDKTTICKPTDCNLLGFQFRCIDNEFLSVIPVKSVERYKSKIRFIIQNGECFEATTKAIHDEITGWFNHYNHADIFLSMKKIKYMDRIILNKMYTKFASNMNIKKFKEMLEQNNRNLSMEKLIKLSDN